TARRFYGIIAYKDADRGQKMVKQVLKANEGTDLFRAREFANEPTSNIRSGVALSAQSVELREVRDRAEASEGSCDRVCLVHLEVPEELRVDADVISSQLPTKSMRDLKAIVDPGAGRSYLCTGGKDCVLPTKEIMRWARLADGSKTSIVKAAVVQ
ncbi:hypothetical protein FOL47_005981, partial [Perkinsus chesapeaki]